MSVRENSIETYKALKDHLSGRQAEVYEYIEKHGKCTERQIKDGLGYNDMNAVRPRVTELIESGLLIEGLKIRDEVTNRPVRTVLIDTQCNHERYKQGHHMTSENARKAMKAGAICWMGTIVQECQECGMDLSEHKVVPVKKPEEYLKERGLW